MGTTEQWLLRAGTAPACALKRTGPRPCKSHPATSWTASLLNLSGISAVAIDVDSATLEQAQQACEQQLRAMGWSWGRPQSEEARP